MIIVVTFLTWEFNDILNIIATQCRVLMGLISLFFKGAEVFSVETVVTPLVPHMPTQTLPEITHWTPSSVANEYGMRKCLMQIR